MPNFVDDGYVTADRGHGAKMQLWDEDGLTLGPTSGLRIARGTTTPTAGSQVVVTGLTTVVAVVVSLQGDPTLTHLLSTADVGDQAGSPAAGSFTLKSWKPTAVDDVTPIAATTPWGEVDWIAIGT